MHALTILICYHGQYYYYHRFVYRTLFGRVDSHYFILDCCNPIRVYGAHTNIIIYYVGGTYVYPGSITVKYTDYADYNTRNRNNEEPSLLNHDR